jgi:KUP system potassium uptake protein
MRRTWKWPLPVAAGILVLFLSFDVPFFVANTVKILDGGWVPVLIGIGFIAAMLIWSKGRNLVFEEYMRRSALPGYALSSLLARVAARVPGTAVFMSSSTTNLPPILAHIVDRQRSLHEQVLLLTVLTETVPEVSPERRLEAKSLDHGFHQIIARFGFMEHPDVPTLVREAASLLRLAVDPEDATYYLGRESLLATDKGKMGRFAETIFSYLQRNSVTADQHFNIPPGQVIEIGIQLDL